MYYFESIMVVCIGRIRSGMVGCTRKRKETRIIMLQAKFYIYIHVINTCIANFFNILFIVYVSVNIYFFTAVDF